jgi:hypothetical protein
MTRLAVGLVVAAGCANADLGAVQGQIWVMPNQTNALFQTAPVPVFSDGACTAFEFFPATHDISAGLIDVTGPDVAFSMEPFEAGYYSPEAGMDVAPDQQVTASAPGVDVPGFTLAAAGVEPLPLPEWPTPPELQLPELDGSPITVTWTASATADGATVGLDGTFYTHGGDEQPFHCEGPDTGGLTMTGAFTAYLRTTSPFGGGTLSRYHADVHTEPDYSVELRVGSFRPVTFGL